MKEVAIHYSKNIREILKSAKRDKVDLYAPSIAYYLIFSLAPILIILVALGGLLFGENTSSSWLGGIALSYFGPGAVSFTDNIYKSLNSLGTNVLALAMSVFFILYGATGLFERLNKAFLDIFNFDQVDDFKTNLIKRVESIIYIIVLFILFLAIAVASVAGNVVISLGQSILGSYLPNMVWGIANYILTLGLISAVFMAIYIPASRGRLKWSSAWRGGLIGGVLFSIVNALFGLYVSFSASISLYGAASFLVVFLLWINYFILSLLLGAEVAKYAEYQNLKKKANFTSKV